jgi:3-oxoacyl-[acyl-carrier protein] reductase
VDGAVTLEGRTAIVTGAGQGVGRGIALALAARGARVVIAARRAETGDPVAREITDRGGEAVCIVTDVTRRADVARCVDETVERFGALHVMVHNAYAGGIAHRLEDVGLDLWEQSSGTAVWGSFFCAQVAFPHLRAAGSRGRLVLVTSPAGVEGSGNIPLYAPVKAAQRAMAKSLAREWGRYGITVNCIAPVAETPALARAFALTPELKGRLEARTPLGRVGDAERDVGGVVAFLASDDAGYVTAQTIVCDGGSFTGL